MKSDSLDHAKFWPYYRSEHSETNVSVAYCSGTNLVSRFVSFNSRRKNDIMASFKPDSRHVRLQIFIRGNMALCLGWIEQRLDSLEQLVSSKMASNSNKRGPTVPYISNVIRPIQKSSIIFSSYYLMYGFELKWLWIQVGHNWIRISEVQLYFVSWMFLGRFISHPSIILFSCTSEETNGFARNLTWYSTMFSIINVI